MVKICLKHNVWLKIPFLNQTCLMATTLVWRWLNVTNTPAYYGKELITAVKNVYRLDENENGKNWNKELKTLSVYTQRRGDCINGWIQNGSRMSRLTEYEHVFHAAYANFLTFSMLTHWRIVISVGLKNSVHVCCGSRQTPLWHSA